MWTSDGALLDRLRRWSQERPDATCLGFYEKGKLRSSLTYLELWKGIEFYATEIALKANRGDRAVLIIEPGMDFIVIFYACLRAGVIAVPCYTPIPGSEQRGIDVFANIATVSSSKLVLLSPKLALLKRWRGNWPQSLAHGLLEYVVMPSVSEALSKCSTTTTSSLPMPARSDVAFLQFTSGSTGSPKGVIIDHGNLASNCCYALALFQREAAFRQTEVICTTWLPMYHDMGLVLATCGPLFFGGQVHFMSPVDFLVDPLVWFDVMSLTNSNVSMAPNFAYNLVNRKWNSPRAKTWDLSAMRCLYNSAEPIQLSTVQVFLQHMQQDVPSFLVTSYGVGYGMAESVAAIGISGFPHPIIVSQRYPTMVASVPNVAFYGFTEIVHPETLQLITQEGEIGEIWVRSPCIARGYWMQPELTAVAFHHTLPGREGEWFRTGDLGFVEQGHLFISGRLKDLIIINGRNFWPQDIESSTQACHTAIRPGCVAAFPVAIEGTESFVVVAEVRQSYLAQGDAVRKCEELVRLVDETIRMDFSHAPLHIVLIKEKTIPKTTSGKIRRKTTKAAWEAGQLHVLLQFATQQHVTDYETALAWVGDVVRSCPPVPAAAASTGGDTDGDTGDNDDDADVNSSRLEATRIEQCTTLLKTFNLLAPDETIAHQGLDSLRLVELLHAMKTLSGQADIGGVEMADLYAMTTSDLVRTLVHLVNGGSYRSDGNATEFNADGDKDEALATAAAAANRPPYPPHLPQPFHVDDQATIEPPLDTTVVERQFSLPVRLLADTVIVGVVFLCVIAAVMPAVAMYRVIDRRLSSPWSYWEIDVRHRPVWVTLGLAIVLTLPCFFVALTVVWLGVKWLLIGRYRAGFVPIFTVAYYRWLLVDRLTALWEVAVFSFIAETPIAVLVYSLAGANVHIDAVLSTPLRCPDLVTIGAFAEVEGHLFPQHLLAHGVSMGPISVGRQSWLRQGSVVHRVSHVEDRVKLEPLAVVPAFHQLVGSSVWRGNVCVREGGYTPPSPSLVRHRWLQWSKLVVLVTLPWLSLLGAVLATRFWYLLFPVQPLSSDGGSHRVKDFWFQVWIFYGTGLAWSLWVFTVKWLLFGRARRGPYDPSWVMRSLRYALGYWNTLAMRLFWLHFQLNLTYLWSQCLGATISPTATVVTNCVAHPADADLVEILDDARVSTVLFQPYDREGGVRGRIAIEPHAEVGHYSFLSAGVVVGEAASIGARVYLPPEAHVEAKHQLTSYTSTRRVLLDRQRSFTFHKELAAFQLRLHPTWTFRLLCLVSEGSAAMVPWLPVWFAYWVYRTIQPRQGQVLALWVAMWAGYAAFACLFATLHRGWEVLERYGGGGGASAAGWHKVVILYWRWLHQVKFMFAQSLGVVLGGTIWLNLALWLSGATVDLSATLMYVHLNDWSKYDIEAYAVINEYAFPFGHVLQGNAMRFGVSHYRRFSCMQAYAVLFPGQSLGVGSTLGSHVTAIHDVADGEQVHGTAQKLPSSAGPRRGSRNGLVKSPPPPPLTLTSRSQSGSHTQLSSQDDGVLVADAV